MTMDNTDKLFAGSIPELYDTYLVPLIFEPYAADLARRVAAVRPRRVLEIAAGTGVATRAMSLALPADVSLVATDLNQPMLDRAAAVGTARPVTWRQADALQLPFDDASFDVVVCQFGVMFFPDKVAAAHQTRRVLRDGGQWWFSVWGTLAENPMARVANETINGFFVSDPPTFYQVPYGYSNASRISDDARRGGFARVAIETVDLEGQAPSAEYAATGLVLGSPAVHAIRQRATAPPETIVQAVATSLAREFGRGEIRFPMRAHVVTAHS